MQTLFIRSVFSTICRYNEINYLIIFRCPRCRCRSFHTQFQNPTLGLICKECSSFVPIANKEVLFSRLGKEIDFIYENRKIFIQKYRKEFFNE